jgi:hypothetical protein
VDRRREIRAGFKAVERGEYADYDGNDIKQLAELVKTRGRRRLADKGRKA